MSGPDRTEHWEAVYGKEDAETSWHQPAPHESLDALDALGVTPADAVVDVGGGTSRLVDALLERGHGNMAVVDISTQALDSNRERLGAAGAAVAWTHADVTTWRPRRRYDVWHDRAVFHFLVEPDDRAAYRETLRMALHPGAALVVATFAEHGPEQCSGLPVARYSPAALAAELGDELVVAGTREAVHTTPWGAPQPFSWVWGRLRD